MELATILAATYRSNVAEAGNCAMRIGERRREEEVDKPSKDKERRVGVFPGILRHERFLGDCCADPRELPDITAAV